MTRRRYRGPYGAGLMVAPADGGRSRRTSGGAMTTPPASTCDRPREPAHAMGGPSSNGRPIWLVALAVTAALVIGGGAWAVTRPLAGGGNRPASALPADTAAYVRLDIDPSLGQKIAAV